MFEKYQEKFQCFPEGCVLTSRKHAVNFYVWHVAIDFPTVPETGKPLRSKERNRKENRNAELDKVIFQLCQIAETIVQFIPLRHEILF